MVLLTEGFFTFDRSRNLSTSLSWNSMPYSAYLWGVLVKNKGVVGLFQISQKEILFHVLHQPSYNLAMWCPFSSLLHPSKKGLSFPFSLSKKRIYIMCAYNVSRIFKRLIKKTLCWQIHVFMYLATRFVYYIFTVHIFKPYSQWKEYIWKLNWKESLLVYFENFQGAPCSHRQSRNRMMNTFLIVNITPICS